MLSCRLLLAPLGCSPREVRYFFPAGPWNCPACEVDLTALYESSNTHTDGRSFSSMQTHTAHTQRTHKESTQLTPNWNWLRCHRQQRDSFFAFAGPAALASLAPQKAFSMWGAALSQFVARGVVLHEQMYRYLCPSCQQGLFMCGVACATTAFGGEARLFLALWVVVASAAARQSIVCITE